MNVLNLIFILLLSLIICNYNVICETKVIPILDVDKNVGYYGKIGEKNVLVDLVPHLQVKNSEQINEICSYHVYKPSDEEFPFIIDIKDKKSGEAIVQLDRNKKKLFDCKDRKFYKFYIEAHDCSEPSIASEKISVNIEVIDHNDHKLAFERDDYYGEIIENKISDYVVSVKAHDNDCTNNGQPCLYEIVNKNNEKTPFKISRFGLITNTEGLRVVDQQQYNLIVRAYDCLDNTSYAEATVSIEVREECKPEWIDYSKTINSVQQYTNVFDSIKYKYCDDDNNNKCKVNNVYTKVKLDLNKNPNGCEIEKCGEILTKINLFKTNNNDNINSYENDDYLIDNSFSEPSEYRTFSKLNDDNTYIKSIFDGNFGQTFQIKSWIRRNSKHSNINNKEHVFCGTDSELMNRHHYALYFYKKNIKFLLRQENTNKLNSEQQQTDEYFSSLWEWSIENIDNDGKWHYYEIKVNYPQVELYIDGHKFEENTTNSDIIDAFKLDYEPTTGLRTTYIGACYHARSHTFTDYFEGDIATLNLYKENTQKPIQCVKNCKEYIEMNMVGNENHLKSIENAQHDEITIQTTNINDMITLLNKLNYVNKQQTNSGKRYLNVNTIVKCDYDEKNSNNTREIDLKQINIEINVEKIAKQEYKVQIEGNKEVKYSIEDVKNGVQIFKDISITKTPINKIDASNNNVNINDINSSDGNDDDDDNLDDSEESDENRIDVDIDSSNNNDDQIYLSRCSIRIIPKSLSTSEKLIYTENDIDKKHFNFTQVDDTVIITAVDKMENYENLLHNLIYSNTPEDSLQKLFGFKQFFLSCMRHEPNIETNTIFVQVNITSEEKSNEYIAMKKIHKFTSNDDVTETKLFNKTTNDGTSPLVVVLVVLAVGLLAFLLVFSVMKLKNRRRNITNEENPQMEWDDSGLNIIENPLDTLENRKASNRNECVNNDEYDNEEYDDYSSTEDDEDGESEIGNYNNYDSNDEPEKILDRELEWDDTTLEIVNQKNENNQPKSVNKSKNTNI